MQLYKIADELAQLLILTDDGELAPGTEEKLDALSADLERKIEGCCCAVRNLEAEETALKEEASRFAKRAQVAGNARDRLKKYMKDSLEKVQIPKMDAGLFKVRIQANSVPSVSFDGDAEKLPEQFRAVTYSIDRKAVVEAWKNQDELPAEVSVIKGTHLRIS